MRVLLCLRVDIGPVNVQRAKMYLDFVSSQKKLIH